MGTKRILITGEKGYVGLNLMNWLSKYPNKYFVDAISVRGDYLKNINFSKYDVVVHAAALVHKKEKSFMEEIYYKINRDLTLHIAEQSKQAGVNQFIFLSSMSVYGIQGNINNKIVITKSTVCNPRTYYGKSKLEAEIGLRNYASNDFKVAIVRPPMIYGPNCPGNYERLRRVILKTPVFPYINNQRSMLFVNDLSETIKRLIDNNRIGLFFPQSNDYYSTIDLVKSIANEHGKVIHFTNVFNPVVRLLACKVNSLNKLFGNLVYDKSISEDFLFESTIGINKKSEVG